MSSSDPGLETDRQPSPQERTLIGTRPDPAWDDIASLACLVCDTPIALIGFVDERREWLKAKNGTALTEIPRGVSFADRLIQTRAPVVIADAASDETLRGHPLCANGAAMRFFAAVPIRARDGQVVGAITVADTRPRTLGSCQKQALETLARQAQRELWRSSDGGKPASQPAQGSRYHSLFKNSHAVMLLIDPADGTIVDANAAACEYYGYTHAQITARSIYEINTLPPDEVRDEIALARAQQRRFFSFRHRLADGRIRDVEVYSGPLQHNERQLLYSIVHDVTGRRQAEETLRKLWRAVEQSPASIVITDTEGRIEYVNPRFTQVTGYTPEEAVGQNPRVLKSGNMPPQEYRRLWETISGGHVWQGEFHNLNKDGTPFWEAASISPVFSPEGAITHYIAVKEDITQHKQAEAERSRFMRDVLASVTEGRLCYCESEEDLPAPFDAETFSLELSAQTISPLRRSVDSVARDMGFADERRFDLISAVGEAAMNAVVHGGGGSARVCVAHEEEAIQVWIQDRGAGIALEHLPRAALESGYTTAGSLGMGMPIMVRTADRIWLLTGPTGTTVVLVQHARAPLPHLMSLPTPALMTEATESL